MICHSDEAERSIHSKSSCQREQDHFDLAGCLPAFDNSFGFAWMDRTTNHSPLGMEHNFDLAR
jgi:hypothetical protein